MIDSKLVVICDRCKKVAGEPSSPFTAGYYTAGGWSKFMNQSEDHICASCMWDDPRYIAAYGVHKKSPGGFRYGDNKTIHGTQHVNVEVDHKGSVVSVWFRCMALPFDQHIVPASRAQEMRAMYREGAKHSITAIVFADGSNG